MVLSLDPTRKHIIFDFGIRLLCIYILYIVYADDYIEQRRMQDNNIENHV